MPVNKKIDYAKIEQLHHAGKKDAEIARLCGCSRGTVANWRLSRGFHVKQELKVRFPICCTECGNRKLVVVDSRPIDGAIRRRRECKCGGRTTTYEVSAQQAFLVDRFAYGLREDIVGAVNGVVERRCAAAD